MRYARYLAACAFLAEVALLCASCPAADAAAQPSTRPSFAPVVAVQDEDYLVARKHFRTKLVKEGPAPQKWQAPHPAEDADEVDYRSGDLRLKALVSRRPAVPPDGKQPAVLFLHGGFAFDRVDWKASQPYRDAGFVVLTPILRGENGQPGSFTAFYDELDDVLAAARYLRDLPYVDRDRVFVAGHSTGGILALFAAMASKDFRAAASFSGSPDQLLLSRVQPVPAAMMPFDRTDPREFIIRSPLAYATSLKCPTRLYFGRDEPWFDEASRRTADLAKARGIDAEALPVDGDHRSAVPEAMKQSIAFFRKQMR